jgi:hypothetical protein
MKHERTVVLLVWWYSIAELPAEAAEVGPGVLPGAVPPVGSCLHHELELLVADASVLVGVDVADDVEDGLLVPGSERVPELVQLDESAAVLVEVPERRRQVVVVGHLPEVQRHRDELVAVQRAVAVRVRLFFCAFAEGIG